MEYSSENHNTQDTALLLQQIVSDLANIKAMESKRLRETNNLRTLFYTSFLSLIFGFAFYSVILQGDRIQEIESKQFKANQTLKRLNAELYNEIQRLDNLLEGDLLDQQDEALEIIFVKTHAMRNLSQHKPSDLGNNSINDRFCPQHNKTGLVAVPQSPPIYI